MKKLLIMTCAAAIEAATASAGRSWDDAARLLGGTFVIGANSTQDGGFFTGRIDDVRVSAGVLKPEEFLQASERTVRPDGIIISFR